MTKEEFTKMKQELEAYVDLITTFFLNQILMLFCYPVFLISLQKFSEIKAWESSCCITSIILVIMIRAIRKIVEIIA